jgi:N-acetylglucosaminyl-diphospho-decaprenol L-rhamnosyltransferase
VPGDRVADVAVLIVGFRNPGDIKDCLGALSSASPDPTFDVFICENGGRQSFSLLLDALLGDGGPCEQADGAEISMRGSGRCSEIRQLQMRGRPSRVWVGCATENFGYAGGINVWLAELLNVQSWKGAWILNPDTEPEAAALAELVRHAQVANKGMVGSTLMEGNRPGIIHCRGGLHWQKWLTRPVVIGGGEPANAAHDLRAIEAAMDCPSGASTYVTRQCIEKVGLMDEGYFLFSEDLDWGLRAKRYGLGYASASIVLHKKGKTTGSAASASDVPRFSVYLYHRNVIRLVRKYFPLTLPISVVVGFLYAVRYLLRRAPQNFVASILGTFAGLRGEVGPPVRYPEFVRLGQEERSRPQDNPAKRGQPVRTPPLA